MKLRPDIASALTFKRDLEAQFEAHAKLPGRAHYSAVYSLPQKSSVMWLNTNPGGTPNDHEILSDGDLAAGLHEFWHGHGRTSIATGRFVDKLFSQSFDRRLSIQGSNVAWHRSRAASHINLADAARVAAPSLTRYLAYAAPELLIFGGVGSFDLFQEVHSAQVVGETQSISGQWGTNRARVAITGRLQIAGLGEVGFAAVSHPSRGIRKGVLEACEIVARTVSLPVAITES